METRLRTVLKIAKDLAGIANRAIGTWSVEVAPGWDALGKVMSNALGVVKNTLDMAASLIGDKFPDLAANQSVMETRLGAVLTSAKALAQLANTAITGYRVGSPAGVDVGFKVFVGAEWPVDMGGHVFTGQDAFFAPQVWARLPSNEHWTWSLSAGVHMSKDFAPNNPGSAPAQPANAQGPLPQGSVSGGDALAFVRLDLEYLWTPK
jgi:hypothetical protein